MLCITEKICKEIFKCYNTNLCKMDSFAVTKTLMCRTEQLKKNLISRSSTYHLRREHLGKQPGNGNLYQWCNWKTIIKERFNTGSLNEKTYIINTVKWKSDEQSIYSFRRNERNISCHPVFSRPCPKFLKISEKESSGATALTTWPAKIWW